MIRLKEEENNFELFFNQKSDLRERIFNNFILDIAEFLSKKDKISLRGISKNFDERIFCQLPINLYLKPKKENEGFNEKNLNILQNYRLTSKITIESLKIKDDTLKLIDMVISSNKTTIKKISIVNLSYETTQGIGKFVDILNNLLGVDDFSITNVGNRDRFFIHLEVNHKILKFANKIKKLQIDNLLPSQIPTIIKTFPHVEELTIENSSIGDDITIIGDRINTIYKENQLKMLNLSTNGFCSTISMNGIKKIIRKQKKLRKIVVKGLWVKSLSDLEDEFKSLKFLTELNLSGAKYLFDLSSSFFIFNSFKSLELLNLSDCKIGDKGMESLLKYLSDESSYKLKELILSRNSISDDIVEIISNHQNKLNSLDTLNLSFNQKISHQGLNSLLNLIISGGLKSLKSVNLNNCGINLKYSMTNLVNFIFTKQENFESLELYFSVLSEVEYINFIKSVFNKSSDLQFKQENKPIKEIRFRLYLKLNQSTNKKLFKKTEIFTNALYTNHNLIIR